MSSRRSSRTSARYLGDEQMRFIFPGNQSPAQRLMNNLALMSVLPHIQHPSIPTATSSSSSQYRPHQASMTPTRRAYSPMPSSPCSSPYTPGRSRRAQQPPRPSVRRLKPVPLDPRLPAEERGNRTPKRRSNMTQAQRQAKANYKARRQAQIRMYRQCLLEHGIVAGVDAVANPAASSTPSMNSSYADQLLDRPEMPRSSYMAMSTPMAPEGMDPSLYLSPLEQEFGINPYGSNLLPQEGEQDAESESPSQPPQPVIVEPAVASPEPNLQQPTTDGQRE